MIRIRSAAAADIPDLKRITAASPTAPQWTAAQFAESIAPPRTAAMRRTILIAEDVGDSATIPPRTAGFAALSALVSIYPIEAELESIAVDQGSRGQGVGTSLLRAAEDWLVLLQPSVEAAALFRLEVRVSNLPAIHLYRRHGFMDVAVRRSYYANPLEDAICMEKEVRSPAPATASSESSFDGAPAP